MARLRYNGLTTTLGASLTSGATSVTFAAALTHSGGTAVPTITGSDYIPLTILTSAGAVSEIVYLTAYTSGATTGTVARGQESTTGVSHASGDKVVNSATSYEFDGETWNAPTLVNSWVNFGSGYATSAYRKDGRGYVELKGVLKGGASPSVAFTLPTGYRPAEIRLFTSGSSNSVNPARIDVGPDGTVTIRNQANSGQAMSIDGVTFLAEG